MILVKEYKSMRYNIYISLITFLFGIFGFNIIAIAQERPHVIITEYNIVQGEMLPGYDIKLKIMLKNAHTSKNVKNLLI